MTVSIVWFRKDLRLQDNPALTHAAAQGQVIPLYIHDTQDSHPIGGASKWWLHHSLASLHDDLAKKGIKLVLRQGSAHEIINQLCHELNVKHVFWNRCYEPADIARDRHIKTNLQTQGIEVKSFNASLLYEPWTILNKQGTPFKVFTPFWRHCLGIDQVPLPLDAPLLTPGLTIPPPDSLESFDLLPQSPNWAKGFEPIWNPSEIGAHERLADFIAHNLKCYADQRDIPAASATSTLSPYLHFGQISPRQIWHTIRAMPPTINSEKFLAELGWREFSYYLLYHFPALATDNFNPSFNHFPWHDNPQAFKAWCKGQTGYPIVDAGMRELWQTGIMHNRVRMITASFLTKHLLIDWRKGADWFWDCLVDADVASNSASWQWVAGCGADAAPYFRIFNPWLQGKKFDPDATYIKKWVPELAACRVEQIHNPGSMAKLYLPPIIDYDKARGRAMAAYHSLKGHQ